MTPTAIKRLELHSSDPTKSEALKEKLRRQYGLYATELIRVEDQLEDIQIRYGSDGTTYVEGNDRQISEFITNFMILSAEQLSCRDDAILLERYRNPDGTLNIYEDPRDWIKTNPMIARLIDAQPSIDNVIDFLCEQRGLFIKPPQYRLQGTYWNSTSNGGLPIVRKRDAIHEGTFMLHDLFHMVIQDPLPFDSSLQPGSARARRNFVSHRMASEAMTMVLADMHAVHAVGLDEEGYDTSKRRIYPVYKDILAAHGPIDVYEVVAANIDFCFTGETDAFTSLGASIETIESFTQKYDTFFSADYDWNDHNYVQCNIALQEHPATQEYYHLAHTVFGLPLINDAYSDEATKDSIIESFVLQLTEAQNYRAHNNEVRRMKEVARRFYGGQLALFFDKRLPHLHRSEQQAQYLELSQQLLGASTPEEVRNVSDKLNALIENAITSAQLNGMLDSQVAALYRMHVPLYPAFFINYQQERERIVPLQRKIALIDSRLTSAS